MSEETLPDHNARIAAIDTSRSFIVQAPAGSGKTGLLIQRYLALLTQVQKPEEILAITFTRKAAAEMRERIADVLVHVSQENCSEELSSYDKKLHNLARKVNNRDAEKNWNLSQNPNRMQILTIDAFCTRLVAAMPIASRFGGMPKLVDDANEIYQAAVRQYFKNFLNAQKPDQSLEKVLLQFNSDFERVSELLVRLLSKRDQWLPYVMDEQLISHDQINTALNIAVEQDLEPLNYLLNSELKAEIVAMASYAAENLRIEGIQSNVLACRNLRVFPKPSLSNIDIWRGIKKLLLTDVGKLRKSVTKRDGFFSATSSKNLDTRKVHKQYKERMLGLLKRLTDENDFVYHLQFVSDLQKNSYTEPHKKLLSALFKVLKTITAELVVEFQMTGQIDFIELTGSALKALGYDESPTDLALVFDSKINHILIDEFQDTSKLHMELLRKLTLGWEDNKRSLFIVGDPMQSIYKFRDANVANFLGLKSNPINSLQLEFLQLESNFRSGKNIVDLNNKIFKDIFTSKDSFNTGEVEFHPSQGFKANDEKSAVSLHPNTDKSFHTEALQILELISNILRHNAKAKIGILVRSRKHLDSLIPLLRSHGLVSSVDGMEKMSSRQEILDIYSLCMALVQPADQLAWLSILRAPWCGLNLEELGFIVNTNQDKLIYENLQDELILNKLNLKSVSRIKNLVKAYDMAFSMLHRDELGCIVEGLWNELNAYLCLESVEQVDNVKKFFKFLRTQTISTVLSTGKPLSKYLSDFIKSATVDLNLNVQLMTIHMSKGLEFDHVILPSSGRVARHNDSDLLIWNEVNDSDQLKYLLLAVKQPSEDSSLYEYIQKRHKRLDAAELKRLFYVAMTRAIKSTHIFCNAKERDSDIVIETSKGTFSALLKPNLRQLNIEKIDIDRIIDNDKKEVEFKRQRLIPIDAKPKYINTQIGGSLSSDKLIDVVEYEWASETTMHIGTVVHLALKQLGLNDSNYSSLIVNEKKQEHYRKVLAALGVPKFELEDAIKKTMAAVNAVNQE